MFNDSIKLILFKYSKFYYEYLNKHDKLFIKAQSSLRKDLIDYIKDTVNVDILILKKQIEISSDENKKIEYSKMLDFNYQRRDYVRNHIDIYDIENI